MREERAQEPLLTTGSIVTGIGAAVGCAIVVVLIVGVRARHAARRPKPVDPAVVGAIAATVSARFPGARVTRIEAEP
jgi:Na+-translocating ferredoxin:NAD+ oxidoreductase RnfA subunit